MALSPGLVKGNGRSLYLVSLLNISRRYLLLRSLESDGRLNFAMKGMLQLGAGQDMPQVTLACFLTTAHGQAQSMQRASTAPSVVSLHWLWMPQIAQVHVAGGTGFLPGWTLRPLPCTLSVTELAARAGSTPPTNKAQLWFGGGLTIMKGPNWLLMGVSGCATSLLLGTGLPGRTAHTWAK